MNWKQLQIFLLAGSTSPASEILKAAECWILYIYRKKQEFHYLELFTHHKIAELVSSIPVGESTQSGPKFYALWMGQHLLLSEFTRVQTTQNISEQEKKKTQGKTFITLEEAINFCIWHQKHRQQKQK